MERAGWARYFPEQTNSFPYQKRGYGVKLWGDLNFSSIQANPAFMSTTNDFNTLHFSRGSEHLPTTTFFTHETEPYFNSMGYGGYGCQNGDGLFEDNNSVYFAAPPLPNNYGLWEDTRYYTNEVHNASSQYALQVPRDTIYPTPGDHGNGNGSTWELQMYQHGFEEIYPNCPGRGHYDHEHRLDGSNSQIPPPRISSFTYQPALEYNMCDDSHTHLESDSDYLDRSHEQIFHFHDTQETGRVWRTPMHNTTPTRKRRFKQKMGRKLKYPNKCRRLPLRPNGTGMTEFVSDENVAIRQRALADTPEKLYHFTNEQAANRILKDKCFLSKDIQWNGTKPSPRFGTGIYFTDIPPTSTTEKILINNYGSANIFLSQAKNTEYCFEFLSKDLPELVFCEDESTCNKVSKERRRNIWKAKVPEFKFTTVKYFCRKLNGFGFPEFVKELAI